MPVSIEKWEVEDESFWETTGKSIANRNLWISIPSLLCGFAVWLYWGIITVQMINLDYPFAKSDLFTLSAIAGLTGATLRIPSTFFIRIAGGRNTIFLTTALLMRRPSARESPWVTGTLRCGSTRSSPCCRVSAVETSPLRCPISVSSSPSGCRARPWA